MNLSLKKIFSTSALLSLIAIFILSCSGNHLICDSQYRETTEKAFNQRKHLAINSKFFLEYVLNPRIANELLVAWRHYFLTKLPPGLVKNGSGDALLIIQYLNDNIRIADDENYYGTPLTPIGVNELKVSDTRSRAIYFVAICRSLGIPAQKKPYRNKGYIKLQSSDKNPVPEYYIHFTLARFEGGRYNTLEYDFNRKITDFKEELPLPPGHYMLVTGNRLDNSKILSNISFFELLENEHRTVVVQIRKDVTEKKVPGNIDLKMIDSLFHLTKSSESCVNDKGVGNGRDRSLHIQYP